MKLRGLLTLILTGLLFLSTHGFAEAVEMNEAEKWFLQGNGYEQNNNLDLAIEAYNKALAINSQFYDAYVRRGAVYKKKGKLEQALADGNNAIAINPKGTAAYFLRGAVCASTGNIKQALEDYSTIISIDPKNARAYVLRGFIYFNGRFAFSVIEKKDPRELSEVQFIEISVKENISRALSDFSRAIELDSDEASIYEMRAGIYSVLNDYDKAVADYNRAIGLTPGNVKLYEKRAVCHRMMKSWEKEWEDWNKIVELDPQNPDGYSMRAIVGKQISKDMNQTIADLTKAIELSQSQEDKRSGLAALFRERGEVFRANGQKDEAIADFNAAIVLEPGISDYYHSRGAVYLEKGDYDMAIADCIRALELYDGSGRPETYVVRGKAYKAKGMDREALNDFNRALEIQPNFEEAISATASMGATNEGYSMLISMQTEIKKMNGVKDVQVLFGEHGRHGDPNKKKTMTVHVVVNKTSIPKMELKIAKAVLERYPQSYNYDIIGIHLLEVEDVGTVPSGRYNKYNAPPKAWRDEIEKMNNDA